MPEEVQQLLRVEPLYLADYRLSCHFIEDIGACAVDMLVCQDITLPKLLAVPRALVRFAAQGTVRSVHLWTNTSRKALVSRRLRLTYPHAISVVYVAQKDPIVTPPG